MTSDRNLQKKSHFSLYLGTQRWRRNKKNFNLLRCSVVHWIIELAECWSWMSVHRVWTASWRRCVCFSFSSILILSRLSRATHCPLCICICRLLTELWTIQFHYTPYACFWWWNSHWEIINKRLHIIRGKVQFPSNSFF